MRSAPLRRSLVVLCAAGAVPLAALACHGDGRDPGANNRAATYVTPASNLPAPVVAPATNTPTAAVATAPSSANPAARPAPTDTTGRDSTRRDTTRTPNRPGTPPANAPAPMRS